MKKAIILRLCRRGVGKNSHYLRYSSKVAKVDMDPQIQNLLETAAVHPKRHPGALRNVHTYLPKDLQGAMILMIGDRQKKILFKNATVLSNYLYARRPPMEEAGEIDLNKQVKNEVTETMKLPLDTAPSEEKDYYRKVIDSKTEFIVKQRKYNWQPIEYSLTKGLEYMVARSCREYVVNYQVLRELKNRFQYAPQTLFDFGSGIGTVLWAASDLWENSLREVFTVDASSHMHDIARELLGFSERKKLQKILHQRQFFPTTTTTKYDVVVSSYSLLELPSARSRLETVLHLWNKTTDFLVLIEFGNKAGFEVINEAREFLLWGMNKGFAHSYQKGHIVCPCPHDLACPRNTSGSDNPCVFTSTYTDYPQKAIIKKELFSYVVFKKGNRPGDDPQWPRVIRPILNRHRHAICRMCTSQGKLSEVCFTALKHGKEMYRCARQSKWGDRLPISIEDIPRETLNDFDESSVAEDNLDTDENSEDFEKNDSSQK